MLNNESKHLLLNWATRQRPGKFMKNLDAYLTMASGKHRITLVVSMDKDDLLCNNQHFRKFLDNKKSETVEVIYSYGESLGKIAAINRDIPATPWDILISTADDMEPAEQGWDDIIVRDMIREFPDMEGCLNYNNDPRLVEKDPQGYKEMITLPIIGRKLYDQFGYVYHPAYKSECCDSEQTYVFTQMKVLRHINSRPITHKWQENQDELMHKNTEIGQSVDKKIYYSRKSNNFGLTSQESTADKKNDMIVQITITGGNELFLLKEMLPIWKKYADAFVFMVDRSTDGTYEFLLENASKYNILSVMQTSSKLGEIEFFESTTRQRMFDEAFKYTGKIICLDSDEYFDGNMTKEQLNELLENNKDTLIYTQWIQYTGKNEIRVDGKWQSHPVDRIASYSKRTIYNTAQTHASHLPMTDKYGSIPVPNLFVSHLSWMMAKKSLAIKQYHYKIWDYVNKLIHKVDIVDPIEYDKSVNNFNWTCVPFPFDIKVPLNIYQDRDNNIENTHAYKYIKESVKKYNIPNLNDWGFGLHE